MSPLLLGALVLLLRMADGTGEPILVSPPDQRTEIHPSIDSPLTAGRTLRPVPSTTSLEGDRTPIGEHIITKTSHVSGDAGRRVRHVDNHIDTPIEATRSHHEEQQQQVTSTSDKWVWEGARSGEGHRVSRGRQLAMTRPSETSSRPQEQASEEPRGKQDRKTNPDIQDIITGIVKLLHGNVNVNAPNTATSGTGRPLRPINTRINNRGPPRITDLPVEQEAADAIGMVPPPPPRIPPPYPFEPPQNEPDAPENSHQNPAFDGGAAVIPLPPQPNRMKSPFAGGGGVPLPEQMVPDSKRPLEERPRPWPRPQPGNKRRPVITAVTNKKPVDDVVFGNKKKDTQYVTVGEFSQDPSEDASVGVSLTMGTDDASLDEVTFTTDTPLEGVAAEVNATANATKTEEKSPEKSVESPMNQSSVIKPTSVVPSSVSDSLTTTTTIDKEPEVNVTKPVVDADNEMKPVIGGDNVTKSQQGVGEAHPVIESSMVHEVSNQQVSAMSTTTLPVKERPPLSTGAYRPRPGIVLDDTEYKPLGAGRPIITAPPRGQVGEVFDVTVSAIQGSASSNTGKPYIYPVEIEGVKIPAGGQGEVSVITAAEEGQHFVSIDGKRTYINLFGDTTDGPGSAQPTRVQAVQAKPTAVGAAGFVVPTELAEPAPQRPATRRPQHQPPVRIDTCIVGDDTTCDVQQNEKCLTENGVSSCHCRPSYSRRKHREPCRRVVSISMSLRVDKLYDRRVTWSRNFQSRESEEYRQLQYEASRALDSAMSMTPFSDEFMGTKVLNIYSGLGDNKDGVYVNVTLQLEENAETSRSAVRHDIQRHLLGVIHRRNNNIGDSALWVDSPPGSVSQLQDIDECSSGDLHDCHKEASCTNVFGSYRCQCDAGTRDPWVGNPHRQGRQCEQCSTEHCNNRGTCRYDANGQQACACVSGFYGAQCEIDGEVLGVAIGASVAAVIIIALTLVCLCMWSRRWSREQKTATGLGSPVFGYMPAGGSTVKTPAMGAPPYQVSLEDRMRWAQIADVMAQANHYAPEPGAGPTRPSSAVFGYPNMGTMQHHMGTMSHIGTLPPIPMPRMNIPHNIQTLNRSQVAMSQHGGYSLHGGTFNPHQGMRTPDPKKTFDSSSSDEEDRTDLLGRNFHVPRPKSRSSVANQSGIYYDVDTDPADLYGNKQHNIPMSTYAMRSNQYFMQQ